MRGIAGAFPTVSEDAMQFASLLPHQVEIPQESFSSSIRVRSQDLTILDKACKVVVVSLETANQFFPLCFAKGSTNPSPLPFKAIYKACIGGISGLPFWLPIMLACCANCGEHVGRHDKGFGSNLPVYVNIKLLHKLLHYGVHLKSLVSVRYT